MIYVVLLPWPTSKEPLRFEEIPPLHGSAFSDLREDSLSGSRYWCFSHTEMLLTVNYSWVHMIYGYTSVVSNCHNDNTPAGRIPPPPKIIIVLSYNATSPPKNPPRIYFQKKPSRDRTHPLEVRGHELLLALRKRSWWIKQEWTWKYNIVRLWQIPCNYCTCNTFRIRRAARVSVDNFSEYQTLRQLWGLRGRNCFDWSPPGRHGVSVAPTEAVPGGNSPAPVWSITAQYLSHWADRWRVLHQLPNHAWERRPHDLCSDFFTRLWSRSILAA